MAHGEAMNYTSTNMAENARLNISEQSRHVRMAIEEIMRDKPLLELSGYRIRWDTKHSKYLGPTVGGVSFMEREWVKSLANAFHVSQDRASHREGTQGYGHDDPRCPKWSPDDSKNGDAGRGTNWERYNPMAYNRALNNSRDVVREFLILLRHRTGATSRSPSRRRCGNRSDRAGAVPGQAPRRAHRTALTNLPISSITVGSNRPFTFSAAAPVSSPTAMRR